MTVPTHPHTAMTDPPDPQPPLPPAQTGAGKREPAPVPAAESQPGEAAAPSSRTGAINWAAVNNGLLPAVLSAGLVALMIIAFTSLDSRITGLENRITSLENRIDARFNDQYAKIEALDAKIEALDAKVDEINLKLTALIAALNKTSEVDAALAGEVAPDLDAS